MVNLINEFILPFITLILGWISTWTFYKLKKQKEKRNVINELDADNKKLYHELIELRRKFLEYQSESQNAFFLNQNHNNELVNELQQVKRQLEQCRKNPKNNTGSKK